MAAKKFNGQIITHKSKYTRYYSTHRICLEYKPLSAPKVEYTLWFKAEDGTDHGYFCTAKEFKSFDVPDTSQPENPKDRKDWERALARSRSAFTRSWNW